MGRAVKQCDCGVDVGGGSEQEGSGGGGGMGGAEHEHIYGQLAERSRPARALNIAESDTLWRLPLTKIPIALRGSQTGARQPAPPSLPCRAQYAVSTSWSCWPSATSKGVVGAPPACQPSPSRTICPLSFARLGPCAVRRLPVLRLRLLRKNTLSSRCDALRRPNRTAPIVGSLNWPTLWVLTRPLRNGCHCGQ